MPSEANNPEGLLCIVRNLVLAFTDGIEQDKYLHQKPANVKVIALFFDVLSGLRWIWCKRSVC